MAVIPNALSMQEATEIIDRTSKELHKLIEEKDNNPKEKMVLMMSYTMGLVIQIKEKLETLESGLGDEYINSINLAVGNKGEGVKTVEKMVNGDPTINESASRLNSNDLPGAVNFLSNRINKSIHKSFEDMPIALKNEITLLHSLCAVITNTLIGVSNGNLNQLIEEFAKNMKIIADQNKETKYSEQFTMN
jgi:hypothetical protein